MEAIAFVAFVKHPAWFWFVFCFADQEVKAMGMSYGERRRIHKIIYDELIFSILKIHDKLDLTSNKDQSQLQEQVNIL